MTDPTPLEVPADSAAGELLTAGATPVQPDVTALMDQIQAMQRQIDAMRVASGVPTDPIGAATKDLKDHVKGRADMHPHADFTEVLNALASLPEKPTTQDAEYVRVVVDEFAAGHQAVEGVEYLQQLARDLYKTVYRVERGE